MTAIASWEDILLAATATGNPTNYQGRVNNQHKRHAHAQLEARTISFELPLGDLYYQPSHARQRFLRLPPLSFRTLASLVAAFGRDTVCRRSERSFSPSKHSPKNPNMPLATFSYLRKAYVWVQQHRHRNALGQQHITWNKLIPWQCMAAEVNNSHHG